MEAKKYENFKQWLIALEVFKWNKECVWIKNIISYLKTIIKIKKKKVKEYGKNGRDQNKKQME